MSNYSEDLDTDFLPAGRQRCQATWTEGVGPQARTVRCTERAVRDIGVMVEHDAPADYYIDDYRVCETDLQARIKWLKEHPQPKYDGLRIVLMNRSEMLKYMGAITSDVVTPINSLRKACMERWHSLAAQFPEKYKL
jgi:hypothetical protein